MPPVKSKSSLQVGLMPPPMTKLTRLGDCIESAIETGNGVNHVETRTKNQNSSRDMVNIINKLTSRRNAYTLKKEKESNQRLIQEATAALRHDNDLQISTIRRSRQKDIRDLQNSINKSREGINIYAARADELLHSALSRAEAKQKEYEALDAELGNVTSQWKEYMHCRRPDQINKESEAIKAELQSKIRQLEQLLDDQD